MIEFLFYLTVFFLFYIYLGYPALLLLLSTIFRQKVDKKEIFPPVTMIISAHNEKAVIREKILNSLALDYPKEKLEIIVASDFSDDGTDDIVREFEDQGVKLVRLASRGGKTAVQNYAVDYAAGEIIVFSDARALYDKDAIGMLIRNFNDSSVGCVGGRLVWKGSLSESKSVVEKVDQAVKTMESNLSSMVGVDGCIYALRKKLFVKLKDDVTSDFVEPLFIISKGQRVIYEPDALCFIETVTHEKDEFRRKKRTVRAGIYGVYSFLLSVNPFTNKKFAFCLFSRKVFRWFTPFLLFLCMGLNVLLCLKGVMFFYCLLVMQVLFYSFALAGIKNKKKIFNIPYRFCFLALAAVGGWIEFFRGNNQEIWGK